jgi:hypothetical protein
MRRLAQVLIGFAALAALSSCGGGGGSSSSTTTAPPPAVAVSVSPGTATVPAGGSQTFSATVQNTTNTAVTWQVNGTAGGSATVGTISTSGVYTAPKLPPSGGTVTISAVSQADTTKSGSATVTVQFSNASVQGPYAFSFNGFNASGDFSLAGSLQADGNGNMTNGLEDLNTASGVFTNLSLGGTYSVGADGRGTATVTDSQGTSTFHFVVLASGQAQIVEFDASENGNGTVIPQDTSAFNLGSLAGNWSFFLSGTGASGEPVADGGVFSLDSAGNVTQGVEDINDGGTITSDASFTGSVTGASSNGRGTVSFSGSTGTSTFAYYVVSANEVAVVETDSAPGFSGTAYKQQNSSFTDSSLSGSYNFLLGGVDINGVVADVGQISANGNGNITNGVVDENDAGTAALNIALTGSYSVAANGRGSASVTSANGTSNYAFYLVSPKLLIFLETDTFSVTVGLADLQNGASFGNTSVSGSYGFDATGAITAGGANIVGQLASSGSGSFTGVEDANEAGTLSTGLSFSGTYSVSSTGRGTAQMTEGGTTSNFVIYVNGPSSIFLLETDPGEVITGFAGMQF